MTLFIDVENKKLVQSLTSDRSVPAPVFMQGDNEPLEIFLLQKGGESLYEVKPLVVGTDFLRVAIARFKGYPKSLTYAAGYTLNPNGGAEVVLPLNTTAIENAVQESEYITAFLEVEYSDTTGRIVTILQTACRIKNDLIENAPAVELQEQFYDRVYTDTVFSKKSANLSDLADKSASRKNLDVYAKSEVYNKSQIDAQEAKNLKKASNLSDIADKAVARANLDVPQKRDLFKYMKCGIWSDTSLSVPSEYGATLGDDFVAGNCSTFLAIYLPEPTAYYTQLYSISYADSGMFTPEISADGKTLKLGYIYQESESGGSEMVERTAAISKAIEYGDRIALTVDGRNFKLYKGIELVSSGTIYGGRKSGILRRWKSAENEPKYSGKMFEIGSGVEANIREFRRDMGESELQGEIRTFGAACRKSRVFRRKGRNIGFLQGKRNGHRNGEKWKSEAKYTLNRDGTGGAKSSEAKDPNHFRKNPDRPERPSLWRLQSFSTTGLPRGKPRIIRIFPALREFRVSGFPRL